MKSLENKPSKGIQVQKPVLPKGGGTVQGMGETFAPNAFNGSSGISVPIPASPCRGFEPQLSLNYSSGNGNSPFGLGWELSMPEIVRRTSLKIPAYDSADTFLFTAGDVLVPRMTPEGAPVTSTTRINNNDYNVYCFIPCKEGEFDKIERYINCADETDDFWKITSAGNTVSIFGKSPSAKIFDPANPAHVFKWLLEETYDDKGDHRVYIYRKENSENVPDDFSESNRDKQTQAYPVSIYYGNFNPVTDGSIITGESKTSFAPDQWHFEIAFDYGTYNIEPDNATPHTVPAGNTWPCRPDPFSEYSSGFEIRTYRLCQNILLFHRFDVLAENAVLVSALELNYNRSTVLTRLLSVKHTGYRYTGLQVPYATKSIPALCFSYTAFSPLEDDYRPHDFEILLDDKLKKIEQAANAPLYQLVDLYGEGIPGILYQDGQSVFYRAPLKVTDTSVEYEMPVPVKIPLAGKTAPGHILADITGNGRLDLALTSSQQAGFWEMGDDHKWKNFIPFQSFPTDYHYFLNDHVDVTGDGVPDVVLIKENSVQYNSSLNKKGFAPALQQPKITDVPAGKSNYPQEVLFYADIIGSGLSQRVRITRNSVECWPNLGYGKFGKKVSMNNAPDFGPGFNIDRLLWADINGSGLIDLAYVHSTHIDIYFNESGNGFAQTPVSVPFPASWDNLSQISFADIKGNGTNCLLFIQTHPRPGIWYYDFNLTESTNAKGETILSSQKPYLLCGLDNGMGALASIKYSGSAKFYLDDKRKGTPWITHLPYPVNVIESVTHYDEVSLTSTTASYHYSHGYYDSYEKEFRGFGRVDVTNSGSFDRFIAQKEGTLAAYNSPDAYTRTWYHTGALTEHEALTEQYKKEFWQGDADALPMNHVYFKFLSQNQQEATLHDAHRTLYGAVIRAEVYGLDDSPWETVPYSVSESEFEVREVQQRFANPYGSFLIHARQSIDYDYERSAADPRVSHAFVLSTDYYGHILETCEVNYPRRSRNVPPGMDEQTKAQQLMLRVKYDIETIFNSNEADAYWNVSIPQGQIKSGGYIIGVSLQAKQYELLNLDPGINGYFTWQDIKQQIDNNFQHRQDSVNLLGWERSYFYDAVNQEELKFGTVLSPVLPHRIESAEFNINKLSSDFDCTTQQQLAGLLTGTTGVNGAKGGYISFSSGTEEDNYYWNPGSSQAYGSSSQFFLPVAFYDPFQYPYIYWGANDISRALKTAYKYDRYNLFVQAVTDPLNNVSQVTEFDYQVMQPQTVSDLNSNTSSVLFDPLGVVIATSQSGKQQGQETGFTDLSTFAPLTGEQMHALFSSPASSLHDPELMTVASCFYYDLHSWKVKKIPVHFKSIVRNYYSIPAEGTTDPLYQLDVLYSDGFGRAAQHKSYYDGTDQWITSGTVRYDNKGQPVEKFEPWFDPSCEYNLKLAGVSDLLFYDALGRETLIRRPGDFFRKTMFGCLGASSPIPSYSGYLNTKLYATIGAAFQPSAWYTLHYDENDSINDSSYAAVKGNNVDPDAWNKAKMFANTPFQNIEDSIGNIVQSGQLNVPENQQDINYFTFDVLGDELTSADLRLHTQGMNNFQHSHNLSKQVIKTISADAGTKWVLQDVAGNIIFSCDSNNTQQYYSYDSLHRFSALYVENSNPPKDLTPLAQTTRLVIYGDSQHDGSPIIKDPKELNLCGKAVIALDEAGLSIHPSYDIHGHPLTAAQWIKSDYQNEANWNSITNTIIANVAAGFQGKYQRADLEKLILPGALAGMLEPQVYVTGNEINAVGQVTSSTDADGNTNVPQYYSNGLVKGLSVNRGTPVKQADPSVPQPGFSNAQYNARGQQLCVSYANNTQTTYLYDDYSFELMHIKTVRNSSDIIQQLHYHHDPAGNITSLDNMAAPTMFFKNQQVDASSSYHYDSLYRLIQATGREHAGMWGNVQGNQNKFNKTFFGNTQLWPQLSDGKALQNYTQQFQYDAGGNLVQLQQTGNTAYTRSNIIAQGSNRAISSSVGSGPGVNFYYDNNGNMTSLEGCQSIVWNYRNNMQSAVIIKRPGNENDAEYYVYNSGGQRVRKVHRQKTQNGWSVKETLYVGGIEIRRTYTESNPGTKRIIKEWHNVKLENADGTFCIWRYWVAGDIKPDEKKVQLRYQLNDILNSSAWELDEAANKLTYEEYYPYGGTSVIAGKSEMEVKQKHYHYSAKEKDNVTGLYYYGMRYYAPWIGRWTCTDPAGTIDGLNIYAFVKGNPSTNIDIGGTTILPKFATLGHLDLNNEFFKLGQKLKITSSSLPFLEAKLLSLDQDSPKTHDVKKVEAAIFEGLSGGGNFKAMWRDADPNTDEHISTASVQHLLEGIGSQGIANYSLKAVNTLFTIVSHFRMPTVMTGNHIPLSGDRMQHPSPPSNRFFHNSSSNIGHGTFDLERRRTVLSAGENFHSTHPNDGHLTVLDMLDAASAFTINSVAPATASDVCTESGITGALQMTQMKVRERQKRLRHKLRSGKKYVKNKTKQPKRKFLEAKHKNITVQRNARGRETSLPR